jgi:acetyl esterase/lipase
MSSSAILLRALALAVGAAALGCASARPRSASRPTVPTPDRRASVPPSIKVREKLDVVCGRGGNETLKLDLYAPKNLPGPLPAIVLIHGGGWCAGSKEDCRGLARGFAEQGYVAITAGYRLVPGYRFPAQLEDVKCAVRWLRADPERCHVDPDRIGALGMSAGGHLALLLGLTDSRDGLEGDGGHPEQSSKVQAVVNVMGPTDLARPGWPEATEKMLADLLGGGRDRLPAAYWSASPMAYVRPNAPPVLTIHGTKDALVPYEQAQFLHAALLQAGVTSRLEPLQDKGHAYDWTPEDMSRNASLVSEFLEKNLKRR